MGYVDDLIRNEKIPYTYLYPRNWNDSNYNVQQAYSAAKRDYQDRKSRTFKQGKVSINKYILQTVTETLKEGGHLNQDLIDIQNDFDKLIHGSDSIFSKELAGLGINGAKLARASDDQLRKMASELKNDSNKFIPLLDNLVKMLDRIQFLGVQNQGLRNKMTGQYGMCHIDEISQVQKSVNKLRALSKGKEADSDASFKFQSGQKEGQINFTGFLRDLRSVFTNFHFHLRGAGNEMIKKGVTAAQLTAPEFIEKMIKGMSAKAGGAKIRFTKNDVTVKTVATDSFSGRVSKGDTQIIINYKVGKKTGKFVVSISEKSGKIKAESYKAKSMHARLVKEANYETVFSGVDIGSQMYFINEYVHGMRDIKGTDILKYLGARASVNILAGIESEGQAFLFREGNELKTLDEIFQIIEDNSNKMDKYINLQISKMKKVSNAKISPAGIGIEEAAKKRATQIYDTFKNSMKFSATFGSKQGF